MHKLPNPRKWILISIALLLTLVWVTPALADYLGPDRTVTTYVSYCRYVQKRCAQQKNGKWEWNTVEDWDCSHGDRGCSSGGGACNEANDGARSCNREEGVREETVTYDPATIAGTVNCTLVKGWCNGASVPELALSASEPVAGQSILLIEGTRNGESFACQNGEVNCSVQLLEGENSFNFWALSSWGDSSLMGNQTARVDTVPPEVGLSVTGTAGHNGWYKSVIEVTAAASDATSGVAKFEVAEDGGAYEGYSPTAFGDGLHTLQFRVVDNAGNVFEAPLQNFNVDTVPPTIDLPAAWYLGKEVEYEVRDNGSGLAAVRVVIEDEDEKYAKVTSDRNASGTSYASHMDWNGQFRDKTVAPPGTYLVWVKAQDVAGNERFEMGKVIVPEPNLPLMVLPTADPLATEVALLPPTELTDVEDIPVTAGQSVVETIGSSSSGTTTTQTILLTTGSAGATASTTTSGVLWGAAAAAAIASATSYALDVAQKRREEEEAQAARVRAEVAQSKAERAENHMTKEEKQQRAEAHEQKVQERKERQSWENPAKEKAKLKAQEEAYQAWAQEQAAAQAALAQKKREEAFNARMEKKMEKIEVREEARQAAAQAKEKEEKKTESVKVAAPAPVSAPASETPAKPSNWWEKTKSFVKNNIIDPVNEKVVQPYIKPAIETTKKVVQVVNEKVVQPYVVPYVQKQIDDAKKAAAWVNEKVVQPYVKPLVQKTVEDVKKAAAWVNEKVVQPYVKPLVQKQIEDVKKAAAWVNEKVVQPYVVPVVQKQIEDVKKTVSWVNEKIVQPYIVPAVTAVNEKLIQPYVQPLVDKVANDINKATTWVDQNIYQPVFAPVVNDINQYIYQPLAEKASDAWDQYGEWVHNALDVAGFIPGFGDIADGINGVIYLAEGRYIEAAVSALSMIPVVGDIVGKSGKLAVKAGTAVAAAAAAKVAKEVVEEVLEKGAKEAAEEVAEKVVKEVVEETTEKALRETSETVVARTIDQTVNKVGDVTHGSGLDFEPDQFIESVSKQLTRDYPNIFPAGTKPLDPSKYDFKPASYFKDLDPKQYIVGAYDPLTGRIAINVEEKGVRETMIHEGLHLLTDGGVMEQNAGQLTRKVGLELEILNPETLQIEKRIFAPVNEGITEMITREIATGIPFSPSSLGYPRYLQAARQLAEKFGPDVIANAYFKNDVDGLIKVIDGQLGDGAFNAINEHLAGASWFRAMTIIQKGMP